MPDSDSCDWPFDENDQDRFPPHPMLNMATWFDGTQDTSLDALIAEITALRNAVLQLKATGGRICERDGRHVSYHPVGEDPFGFVEDPADTPL